MGSACKRIHVILYIYLNGINNLTLLKKYYIIQDNVI